MRSVLFAVAVAGSLASGLVGCNDDTPDFRVDAGYRDAPLDAPPPPWWQPKPGTANNFDVQLSAPYDLRLGRTMYILDLWDLVPAPTVLDYGDGNPITIPAGVLAGTMVELHARRPRTVVICDVGTGGLSLTDPDASKFPGFEASPPNFPDVPAPNSVIGWSVLDADSVPIPNERFLDIRADSYALVKPLIEKRFDLAKQIGCDGITGRDNIHIVDPMVNGGSTGFTTSQTEGIYELITSRISELAVLGHGTGKAEDRQLSMGLRDGWSFGSIGEQARSDYDWVLAIDCGADPLDSCRDLVSPFTDVEKAALALDYGTQGSSDLLCMKQLAAVKDGIVKDPAMSSTFRRDCFATPPVTP